MLRKIITWALAVFLVYYLCTQGAHAAAFARGGLHALRDAGRSMSRFVNDL
jgi:hypothetical protein